MVPWKETHNNIEEETPTLYYARWSYTDHHTEQDSTTVLAEQCLQGALADDIMKNVNKLWECVTKGTTTGSELERHDVLEYEHSRLLSKLRQLDFTSDNQPRIQDALAKEMVENMKEFRDRVKKGTITDLEREGEKRYKVLKYDHGRCAAMLRQLSPTSFHTWNIQQDNDMLSQAGKEQKPADLESIRYAINDMTKRGNLDYHDTALRNVYIGGSPDNEARSAYTTRGYDIPAREREMTDWRVMAARQRLAYAEHLMQGLGQPISSIREISHSSGPSPNEFAPFSKHHAPQATDMN